MLKRKIATLILSSFFIITLEAAPPSSLRTLFIEMPDSVIPVLTKNNRLDMLDFMDSGMNAKVVNLLGGESVMKSLNQDTILIEISPMSNILIYTIHNDMPLICVEQSFGNLIEYMETTTKVYTKDWKLTSSKLEDVNKLKILDWMLRVINKT